jgi:hypothetical protein
LSGKRFGSGAAPAPAEVPVTAGPADFPVDAKVRMRRVLIALWILMALASLGARFHFAADTGTPRSGELVRGRVAYYAGGLVAPSTAGFAARCDFGIASLETRLSPGDVLATLATAGLYSPRTVEIACAESPAPFPSHLAGWEWRSAGGPATVTALGDYTAHSDDGVAWRLDNGRVAGEGYANQSVLIRNGATMGDGWVEAATAHADDGGLVLRFQDNVNYYLLAIRDDAGPEPRGAENLKVYRRDGGRFRELWSADVAWPRGERRTVRFEAEGSLLNVYLDGELIGSVVDSAPLPAGGFGLRHHGVSQEWTTRFDAFRWRAR